MISPAGKTAPAAAEGPLPLVVGVVGHRHLEPADYPIYRARVVALFAHLRAEYPATPLRVISALAEGADRLVADMALQSGCDLIVPLPMPTADYEQDFPQTAGAFRELLARAPAGNVFVLPSPHGDSSPLTPQQRDARYLEAGIYIAGQCHLLLALWDGVRNNAIAGTAEVVRFKLEGHLHADDRALSSDDRGPVYRIHAPRAASGASADVPATWLFPADSEESSFRTVCARIDRFNRDATRARVRALAVDTAATLIPDLAARPRADRLLAGAFAHADALARHYQRLTHAVLRTIIGLTVALALTFEIYAEIMPRRELPALYLVIFAAIAALFLWHRRFDAQGRYLDYRALAEALRVQFYWRLGGLGDSAAASYLRKQLDELRWIRDALRGTNTLPPPTQPRMDLVLGHWVHGQAQYYRSRAGMQSQRIHRIERMSELCLIVGLTATTMLLVLWHRFEVWGTWRHWVVLVMGFAPIAAALWEVYGERFGLRSQAHQYARFAAIFARAEKTIAWLEAAPQGPQRDQNERALLRELGRESLMENGDWVLSLRERPIALPKG